VAAALAVGLTSCGRASTTDEAKPGGTAGITSTTKTVAPAEPVPPAKPVQPARPVQPDKAVPSAGAVPPAKAVPPARAMPSAKAVYEQMRANVAAAKSVRIKGALTDAGKNLKIDVAGDRDGRNTRALVSDGAGQAELRTVGRTVYIKADVAYWTRHASAAAARIAADKFVRIPGGTGVGDLKVGTLLDGAFTDLPLAGAFQKVEATRLNGAPAYLLADRVGSEGRIYVSADGEARLLRIVSTKANVGALDFSQWNAVPPQSPPPADQVVKIRGLG
jgi:hypothetical protein